MDSIQRFQLDQQDLAATTKKNYGETLKGLSKFCDGKDVEQTTEVEVKQFLADSSSSGTYNLRLEHVRCFYHWLGNKKWFAGMKRKKTEPKVTYLHIPAEHIQWIASACQNLRDQAMIAVMFDCGFRRGEVVAVRIGDVIFDQYGVLITCPRGKTGQRPVRGIACTAILMQWMEAHPLKGKRDAPLFCSIKTKQAFQKKTRWKDEKVQFKASMVGDALEPHSVQSIYAKVERTVRQLHPDLPHIHPHLARHYEAIQCARKGMSPHGTMLRHGWKSLAMPLHYIHLTGADADEQYLRAMGVKKMEDVEQPSICPRCKTTNIKGAQYCARCGSPMTLAVVEGIEKKEKEGLGKLIALLRSHPEVGDALKDLKLL